MLDQLVVSSSVIGSCSVSSTGPLPVVFTAAAFRDLPYSPALLLNSSFSAKITDDPKFHTSCGWGYEAYFEEMYAWDEEGDNLVFVAQPYTWADVVVLVVNNTLHWKLIDSLLYELPSHAQDAGFVLGWLSAHALVDRPVSLQALEVLRALIEPALSLTVKR